MTIEKITRKNVLAIAAIICIAFLASLVGILVYYNSQVNGLNLQITNLEDVISSLTGEVNSLTLEIARLKTNATIIYSDDFDSVTFKWIGNQVSGGINGSGSAGRYTATGQVFRGDACMQVLSGWDKANMSSYYCKKYVGSGVGNGRVGLSFWLNLGETEALQRADFIVEYSNKNNGKAFTAGLRYDHSIGTWKYLSSTGAYADISGAPEFTEVAWGVFWYHVKFVFDVIQGRWVYVDLFGHHFDMSPVDLYSYIPNHAENFEPMFEVGSKAGTLNSASLLVDDVILTVDE